MAVTLPASAEKVGVVLIKSDSGETGRYVDSSVVVEDIGRRSKEECSVTFSNPTLLVLGSRDSRSECPQPRVQVLLLFSQIGPFRQPAPWALPQARITICHHDCKE